MGKYNGITATLFPNPDGGKGYLGSPITFNNKVYFAYFNDSNKSVMACFDASSSTLVSFQNKVHYGGSPVVYKNNLMGILFYRSADADSVSLGDTTITNGYCGSPIVFNNDLYFAYRDKKNKLAKYDGLSTTVYENPDTGIGFVKSPVIFNNKIFFMYENSKTKTQLATLNGNTVVLIPNPDSGLGINGHLINFNNGLYVSYINGSSKKQLAKYNGSGLTLISNPDSGSLYFDQSPPVVLLNNLFFGYRDTTGITYIAKYDGSLVKLLANPDTGSGYAGKIQLYNDILCFGYVDVKKINRLAKCDGDKVILLDNPDAGKGYMDPPVVYNNKLYFMYITASGLMQLTFCNGNSINITEVYLGGKRIPVTPEPPHGGAESGPYIQSLSNIVEFKTSDLKKIFYDFANVYPNPFNNSFQVSYTLEKAGDVAIELYNISGVLIMDYHYHLQPQGRNQHSINTEKLPSGIYTLKIIVDKKNQTIKCIKE